MTTSVIEVGGMLSPLSSHGVEKHLGKPHGVHHATVNYAAGNDTVRYDEVLITITEITEDVVLLAAAAVEQGSAPWKHRLLLRFCGGTFQI